MPVKTIFAYLVILYLLFVRLNNYCGGNFSTCSERVQAEQKANYDYNYEKGRSSHIYQILSQNTGSVSKSRSENAPISGFGDNTRSDPESDSKNSLEKDLVNAKNYNFSNIESIFEQIRTKSAKLARKYLPSPHSELLLGMTIGVDDFYKVRQFKEMLRKTGTIHVVVVSGFNISLVFNWVVKIIGSPYKPVNLVLAVLATLLYALLSGFNPPVFRAWIMGSVIALSKYYGRKIDVLLVLCLSAFLMLLYDPRYLFSLSFQLSFMATLGLIMFSEPVGELLGKFGAPFRAKNTKKDEKGLKDIFTQNNVVLEDLSATVSAQLLVWPIISASFSTFSIVSFVINALTLWVVPFITVWGMGFIIFALLFSGFEVAASAVSLILYFPLEFFVNMVENFSKFPLAEINLQIGKKFMFVYYAALFLIWKAGKFHQRKKQNES